MSEPAARRPTYVLVAITVGAVLPVVAWLVWGGGLAPDPGAQSPPEVSGSATATDPAAGSPGAVPGAPGSPAGAVAPTEPAEPDTTLEPLPVPPERSLWALSADSYAAGIEVAVEFEPYGVGPSSFGPSIVALVITAKPIDPAAEFPDIVDKNVVFLVGDTTVDKGGRYEGTAVTRTQDDRVVLVLKDARPVP